MKMNVTALAAMPVHEAAMLFPMMQETETEGGLKKPGPLTQLASDLKDDGCLTPVVLWKGNILDGRNRIAAAKLAGLDFLPTVEYNGSNPIKYVISLNLHRRHLTKAQLVELGINLIKLFEGRQGQRSDLPSFEGEFKGETSDLVVEMMGGAISGATFERGKAVAERAPELWREVQSGARSVSDAYSTMQGPPSPKPSPKGEDAVVLFDAFYDKFMDALDRVFDAGLNDEQRLHIEKMCKHLSEYAVGKSKK